jgi:DNA-binding NarL/FixJ family response regulator
MGSGGCDPIQTRAQSPLLLNFRGRIFRDVNRGFFRNSGISKSCSPAAGIQNGGVARFSQAAPSVLILKADTFAAEALGRHVLACYPNASCMFASRVNRAQSILLDQAVDLFLTGIDLPDGDVLDLLLDQKAQTPHMRCTLVVTRHHELRLLASLRSLAVAGLFDMASEPWEKIEEALQIIDAGGYYWSESMQRHLMEPAARALLHQLTPTEQLALAMIGDGCGDKVAADRLGMTFSAIRAVRRDLHDKLGAHDRADLIRLAVHYGYVRFTPEGAFPVGLGVLRREYAAHCKRPVGLHTEGTARLANSAGP